MQLFLGKLKRVLSRAPPPEPSSAAINLMIGVGKFQVGECATMCVFACPCPCPCPCFPVSLPKSRPCQTLLPYTKEQGLLVCRHTWSGKACCRLLAPLLPSMLTPSSCHMCSSGSMALRCCSPAVSMTMKLQATELQPITLHSHVQVPGQSGLSCRCTAFRSSLH